MLRLTETRLVSLIYISPEGFPVIRFAAMGQASHPTGIISNEITKNKR